MRNKNITVGFIGQGYVGKNYANDFENRGYKVVRYSLEKPYVENKQKILECEVVFIAVPTPTTPKGFDAGIVEKVLSLPQKDSIVVIKSTVIPGLTQKWQKKFPHLTLIFSPEFLREATAAKDTAHPYSNIIGIAANSEKHKKAAELLLSILPEAPHNSIITSTEAELVKYAQNVSGYIDIVTFNIFYDIAKKLDADWGSILKALEADPNVPSHFANPIHKSGRGAGGNCLIKDMAALRGFYENQLQDEHGVLFLRGAEEKNKELLRSSKKDIDLLNGVYGEE